MEHWKSVVANRNTKKWTAEIEEITIAATRCGGVEWRGLGRSQVIIFWRLKK
jgi:hypothetical protein